MRWPNVGAKSSRTGSVRMPCKSRRGSTRSAGMHGSTRGTVQIRNGGQQPIYDVSVTMTHAEFQDETTSKGVVPPVTTHPKTDWTLRARGEPAQPDRAVTAGEFDVEIEFRDAEGRKWKRDVLGGLHLLETRVAIGQARETDAAGSLTTPRG